jgi:hypothetical protein
MPRANPSPPARLLTLFAVSLLVAGAALLSAGAAPAEAAKPCWERVIDDWTDNGLIEGDYPPSCITAARRHVPEDLRTYTDILDKLDAYLQGTGRTLASAAGSEPKAGTTKPKAKQLRQVREPKVKRGTDGPIQTVLGSGTTDASSIPLPLIVLAGLALLLMAAGGAGFAYRKLKARRIASS